MRGTPALNGVGLNEVVVNHTWTRPVGTDRGNVLYEVVGIKG